MPVILRLEAGETAREAMRSNGAWLALTMVLLGVQLLRPSDTFGSAPQYAGMARIASEITWGLIFILVGIGRLASIWHGAQRDLDMRSLIASCIFCGASSLLWIFLSVLFYFANPSGWFFILTFGNAGRDFTTSLKLGVMIGETIRGRERSGRHGR